MTQYGAAHAVGTQGRAARFDLLLALVGLTAGTLALGVLCYRRFRADILDEL